MSVINTIYDHESIINMTLSSRVIYDQIDVIYDHIDVIYDHIL